MHKSFSRWLFAVPGMVENKPTRGRNGRRDCGAGETLIQPAANYQLSTFHYQLVFRRQNHNEKTVDSSQLAVDSFAAPPMSCGLI
jgi:hypothetical protein